MASFLRTAAVSDRSYVSAEADAALDEIAEGQSVFLDFARDWSAKYDGGRAAFSILDDFLVEYFHPRLRDLDPDLDEVGLPPAEDPYEKERERRIDALMGGRA